VCRTMVREALDLYRKKRDFTVSPEPRGRVGKRRRAELGFLVQKHAATRLHYDFRLELDGVLLSWAVPKGPSLDPKDKRLAVHVEDHSLEYGGGTVLLWDRGTCQPTEDPEEAYKRGRLKFVLDRSSAVDGSWSARTGARRRAPAKTSRGFS